METYYDVFHRTWWKKCRHNPSNLRAPRSWGWPNGLEPGFGKKHYIAHHVTREDALELCEEYNSTHEPGRLSDKAEFEEV
jgi:hypothetical protein